MSAVAKAAQGVFRNDVNAVRAAAQAATLSFRPEDFLAIQYEAFPKPMENCATLHPTRDILAEDSHPYYPRVRRRAQNFDPAKLHWRIACKVDASNSAFIRGWAAKRLKNAIIRKLKEEGLDERGQPFPNPHGPRREPLVGALIVHMSKHNLTLNATKEQLKITADWLLDRIQDLRRKAITKHNRRGRNGPSLGQHHDHVTSPSRSPTPSQNAFNRSIIGHGVTVTPEDIRKQIEYYFSDANLPKDRYLTSLTDGPENRPVSLRTLCSFSRMKDLRQPYTAVLQALRESKVVEVVDMEGTAGIRRRVPLDASRWVDDEFE